VSQDGKRLYVGVPSGTPRDVRDSNIAVIDIDPISLNWGNVSETIPVAGNISSIITTPDTEKLIVSYLNPDARGIGILENHRITKHIDVTIGNRTDYFDVNTATGMAFLPANTLGFNHPDYLFVAGKNFPPASAFSTITTYRFVPGIPFPIETSKFANESVDQYHPYNPGGGSIGIIQDPFGSTTQLTAATRPIPVSFPESVALSPDGKYLVGAYIGTGAVFTFDVKKIIETIQNSSPQILGRFPIDDLNPAIDFKADYQKIHPDTREPYTFSFGKPPVFGVPANSQNAPLAIGGFPYQVAV